MRLFRHIGALAAFVAISFITVGTASGSTALQKAVHKGDIKKVQELLDKGADVNEWNFGTALIWAASENRLEIAKLLIDRGADVNSLGKNGWTALGCAAAVEGYGDMIDLLISKGADIDQAIAGMKTMAEWAGSASAKAAAKIVQGMGLIQSRAGMAFYSSGQYEKAASVFRSRTRVNPRDPENFIWLAFSNVALKKYDEAKAAAESAIMLAPDHPNAYVGLADSLTGKGDFAKAVEPLKKGIGLNPKNPWIYNRLGNVFFSLGNYPEAVANYQAAAELTPNNPDIYYQLGTIHARAGKFDEAIAALDKAVGMVTFVGIGIETGIENGQPFLQRLIEGPAKEAGLKAGDRLIMIDGQSTKGWDINKTSQSLRGEENTQVVLKIQRQGEAKPFERTITRKLIVPKAAAPYYGYRSLCAREKGNREGAVKDAELAYSLDPDNEEAREALAAVNLDGGKYEEAIKLLSPLKDNPFARILEATAYAKQNDLNRAIAVYLAIPEDELSATALRRSAKKELEQTLQGHVQARLDKARASESAGRFLEALAEYAEAVKIVDEATAGSIRQRVASLLKSNPYLAELPEEARKYALRGDILIKEGGFADALAEYRTALGIAPFNAQLHFNTALIHGQLKDYRGAIKSMTIYLQLNPDAPNARAAKDEIYKWEFSLEKEGKK
jgi:tetratricopeptide (TPR) repeat protein